MRSTYCEDCDTEVSLEEHEQHCPECGAYLFDLEPEHDKDFEVEDYGQHDL